MRANYGIGDWLELTVTGKLVNIQGKDLDNDILTLKVGERERQFHTDIMTIAIVTPAPRIGGVYIDTDKDLFLFTEQGWFSLADRMFVSDGYMCHPVVPYDPEEDAL